MLPSLISRICEIESLGVAVVLDSKDVSEKDKHIWEFRTGGLVEYEKEGLYGFAARGVCFYFVENHNSMECARLLNNINPALIVNGGTPRKLKSEILRIPALGVINVHPGVLPKYRGSCCVEWAIYNDELVGNTSHFMTEEYDAGPIIEVETYKFQKGVSYHEVRAHIYRNSIGLMAGAVEKVLDKKVTYQTALKNEGGALHPPIAEEKMGRVIHSLDSGSYKHLY